MRFRFIEGLLTEDIDAVKKNYPDIDDETFNLLLNTDPTFNPNRNSVGKYTKWILNQYKKGNIVVEKDDDGDFVAMTSNYEFEIRYLLEKFADAVKTKNINKDINSYKKPQDIYSAVRDSMDIELTKRQKERQARKAWDEAEKLFDGEEWEIWTPLTYRASCTLGSGTKWCTAAQSEQGKQMWTEYTGANEDGFRDEMDYGQGDLFVVINKKTGEKYQFHFESDSYMDAEDEPIDIIQFFIDNYEVFEYFYNQFYDYNYSAIIEADEAIRAQDSQIVYPDDTGGMYSGTLPYIKDMTIWRSCDEDLGTKTLDVREFWDFTGLENVEIEEGIENIEQEAFITCTNLKDVYLPKTISVINNTAFPSHCTLHIYPDAQIVRGMDFERFKKIMGSLFPNTKIVER